LAAALDSIFADPERAANLGMAGRVFALSAFSPESAARRYADIYKQVLGDRAA
jgi:glycosyltransferase involved in cell wall biosynthesis